MKIGILYICTGKYSIFWDTFYKSSERFFLTDDDKYYFVFTDSEDINSADNIFVKYKSSEGFPMDSLNRFKLFFSIENELKEMDYLFFFNSNMRFVDYVATEVLPLVSKSGIVALNHIGQTFNEPCKYPYERNKRSKAYIPYEKGKKYRYFMGGLNGGKAKDYLELIRTCYSNIEEDKKNGLIAIYHDESHLNAYLNTYLDINDILILDSSYGMPEDSNLNYDPKIIILNKMKHGGKYFDKLPRKSYFLRFYLKLKRLYSAYIWKFQ